MYPSIIVFILVSVISECKGQDANTCNVTAKNEYIEAGSDTEVRCQSSCVRGKVFWTLNNRDIKEIDVPSMSETIDSSHTTLSLWNFTYPSATLQCHSAVTHQVIGGVTIKTYTKPSEISCMLHYEYQTMEGLPNLFTCNWKHHTDSSLKVNYTVLVSSLQFNSSDYCNSSVTTCTMTTVKIPQMRNNTVNVTVKARTDRWKAESDPYEFARYSISKINPPKITVTVSSDHLLVEWERPPLEIQCHCEVKFSKAVSDGTEEMTVNRTLNKGENGRVEKKMESCSTYKVSVRCALVEAPWSDWSQEQTVQTGLNEIDIKLQLWRKVSKPQSNGIRKVHAMWTGLPATCPGTFTYTIKQTAYDEHETEVRSTDTSCNSSTCDVHVGQQAHKLNLTVFRNGTQLAEESVYVPAIAESLPQVSEVETSTTGGVILVSWQPPVEPVRSYMIDWTHNGHEYYWMETEHANMTLFGLLDKKPYNITVTPLFDDRTGQGTDALPVCATLGDPGNITFDSVHPYDTSAYVSWSIKSQEECSEAVNNYTIFYQRQKGPTFNVTVDSTARDISLKDLDPETQYTIYITGTAHNGTTKSNERLFKTKRFDPRLLTALSVSGSIVIFLVFSLGLCCAVQWKKFREKPVPNPGLSSVALWPSSDHQKAFSNPSESLCDPVYTVEPQGTSISPLASGCNRATDQTEEYTDPAALAPNVQNEQPAEPPETEHVGSGESTALLLPSVNNNSSLSPYRSQSSVEIKSPGTVKQCKPLSGKQQEKTAPMTVYVTLNMFEQGQAR